MPSGFQSDTFQNDAFQAELIIPQAVGGGSVAIADALNLKARIVSLESAQKGVL